MKKEIVIVSAARTAVASFNGSLAKVTPGEMGAIVIKEALKRANLEPNAVDEVFVDCVLQLGHGRGVARQSVPVQSKKFRKLN